MAQRWHDLLFAHWPVAADILRDRIPSILTLDTFEGSAWIGVIPFRMSGVRPRGMPPLPWLSAFPELNVRTYVTVEGKPGVYFFSLDAANRVAVRLARIFYHLPYFLADMSVGDDGGTVHYRCRRVHRGAPPAEFIGRYKPTGDIFRAAPGTLEHWLTERYCLYTVDSRRRLSRAEIHHWPWPLQPAEAEIETNTMAGAQGIPLPNMPPLLHFARRLDVLVWAPKVLA